MGFIQKFKNTLNEFSGALKNLLSGQDQQTLTEAAHYEAIIHHLDRLEHQMNPSVMHHTERTGSVYAQISGESSEESLCALSPDALTLIKEIHAQQEDMLSQWGSVRESVLSTSKSSPGADHVSAQLSKLATSVSRHNMVLEDLIESMEDFQKKQKAMVDQMGKLAEREENAEISSLKSSEDTLFKLIETYHDQFHIFERASRSDPSWNRQFSLFRQIIDAQLQASGISVIEQTGIPVNYALHEVIDSVPTDDPALNHHVAAIYDCGYIFRGTLKRKARISAYRCSVPSGQPEEDGDSVM